MYRLLDVRFSFLCRTTHQNDEGKNPILLRIKCNGNRRDVFTGLYCYKKDWNITACKVSKSEKSAPQINNNLEIIIRKAHHIHDTLRLSGNYFSIDTLLDKIKGKEKKPNY